MESLSEISQSIRAEAKRLGISKFDVFGRTSRDTAVKVEDGAPGQISSSQKVSFAVRVWDGQAAPGIAYTSDLSPTGIASALGLARDAARHLETVEPVDFSLEASSPMINKSLSIELQDAGVPSMVEALLAAEKSLKGIHPSVKGVPYNLCHEGHLARLYLNSDGVCRMESFPVANGYLVPRAEEEGKKPRVGVAETWGRTFKDLDMMRCATEAGENLLSHLDYDKVPTGNALTVFSPEAVLALIGAFGNFVNARRILDSQSLVKPEMVGTLIASPLLSIVDDVAHPSNVAGPLSFDEEGTPTRRLELVSNGTLVGLVHTAATAKRMNVSPTGNAVVGSKVTCGVNFLVVERGEQPSRERDISEEKFAVYVDELEALHSGVHALQGSFSLPFKGWIWKNGVRRSVEAGVVSGDFFTMLRAIVYVGAVGKARSEGFAPDVWVDGLAITGE